DLHAEEEIGPDRRSSRSRVRGEEFRVDFVHPAEVLEMLEIHGRREDVVEVRGRRVPGLPEVVQWLPGLEPDVAVWHFAISVQLPTAKLAPSRSRSLRFVSGPPSEE